MPICCLCGIERTDDPDGLCDERKKYIWKQMENGKVIEFPRYMDDKVTVYIEKVKKQQKQKDDK